MANLVGGSVIWNLDAVGADKFSATIDSAQRKAKDLGSSLDKAGSDGKAGLDKAATSSDSLQKSILTSVVKVVSLKAAFDGIKGALSFAIKSASDMEMLRSSLDTLTGSAESGASVFQRLADFAAKTPFETRDLADATKTMLSFGISSEDALKNLRILGDVSLGNKEKLGTLTLAFSQIQSTGRLMGQDLLQLINAGFNPLQIISEKTGKSMATLKDEMAAGKISAEQVADAFKTATSEGGLFYQGMDRGSQTLEGKFSTLKDSIGVLARKIVGLSDSGEIVKGGLVDKLKDGIGGLTTIIDNFDPTVFQGFLDFIKNYGVVIAGAIMGGLVPAFTAWTVAAWASVPALLASGAAALVALAPVLMWAAIGAVVAAAIAGIVYAFQNWGSIVEWFKNVINGAKDIIINAIGSIQQWFSELPEKIGYALGFAIGAIVSWGVNTWNYLVQNVPIWIANIGKFFSELPGKIKTALTNLGPNLKDSFVNGFNAMWEEVKTWPGKIMDWGKNIGSAFVDGVKNALGSLKDAFKNGFNNARGVVEGNSPPKEGPFKEMDKWGYNVGISWVDGLTIAISKVKDEIGSSLIAAVPEVNSTSNITNQPALAPAIESSGGFTQQNHIEQVVLNNDMDVDTLLRDLGFAYRTRGDLG